MPVYEYKCDKCKIEFKETRSITTPQELINCPHCDTVLMRVFNVPVVTFNGTGFYATDKKK